MDQPARTALERKRSDAVVNRDFDAFEAVAHQEPMYTHYSGNTDRLESYMQKCRNGFYAYHRIDHPITKIVINGDVALVLWRHERRTDRERHPQAPEDTYLAVWVREGGAGSSSP